MSDEDFSRVIDVNLKGAFHTTRALARAFGRRTLGPQARGAHRHT